MLLKLFHIRSHRKRRSCHLELQIRVPSRLLQYRLIHKLRIQRSDILTRDIQQRSELELLRLVVRFIYKVRAVAVGLHLALESRVEDILVEFSQESARALEGVRVDVGVVFVSHIESGVEVGQRGDKGFRRDVERGLPDEPLVDQESLF